MSRASLCCVAVLLLVGDALAGTLERIGNPMSAIYRNPGEKDGIQQIVSYEGKLYIAHGGTNAKEQCLALYLDPKTWTFGHDLDDDGKPVLLDAEVIMWARVFGADLHMGNYDPVRGQRGAFHYRKRNGKWEGLPCGPDGHPRDFFRFDDKLFTFDGSGEKMPYPRIRWSQDDGKTWAPVDASALYDKPSRPGWEFFTFKGRLYAGFMAGTVKLPPNIQRPPGVEAEDTTPAVLVYTGNDKRPFDIAYASTEALFGQPGYRLIRRAIEIKGKLIFEANGLYVASSLAPDETRLKQIELKDNARVLDITQTGGSVYVLTRLGDFQNTTKPTTYVVLQTRDGELFTEAARFDSPSPDVRDCRAIAVVGTTLVAGFQGGDFFRTQLNNPEKP